MEEIKEEQTDEKGTTWLELIILFPIHGGWSKQAQKTEEVNMGKVTRLQSALKQFKADITILRRQCVEEQHELYLITAYSGNNRLKQLAAKNTHTMSRGVPQIDDDEAETITKAILAMKGIHQLKYRTAWQEGNLKLSPKPMCYKGSTHVWMRNIKTEDFDDWTRGNHEEPVHHITK